MKKKKYLELTIGLLVIFIIYTLLIKYIDVSKIGPGGSEVGFSSINKVVHDTLGYNDLWYKITKYLGIIPFLYVAFYGLQGILQLIKYKSLKKVDKKLIYLGIFYVLMGICYILFEKIIINYRPVLLEGELEASYPSSHTLLAICISASSLILNKYYINNKKVLKIINILTVLLMLILTIGRLLSGVHWFTDIIGGIILSSTLVSLYYTLILNNKEKI